MTFKWTIYKKIQILILVILIVVYSIANFIFNELIDQNTQNNFESNVINTSLLLQKNIEVIFSDSNNSLTYIKENYEFHDRDDIYIRNYLAMLNQTKVDVINSFIAYNDGSFVLEPSVKLPDTFDPRNREWYKTAYESRTINWSDPYIDVATGEIVISGSIFIQLQDTDGVLGLDIQLSNIPNIINTTNISENGFILLVNEEGTIITDSKDIYTGLSIVDIKDEEFANSSIITGQIKTDKGVYYIRRLNQTNMRLVAFLPIGDLTNASEKLQFTTSLILLLALFVGLIIAYFVTKRITKPIEKLTKTMLASKTTENLILLEESGKDEIKTLVDVYNSMAIHVNKQNDKLKTLSEELIESEEKLNNQYQKVSDMAYSDSLTGLPNRFSFEQVVKSRIEENQKFSLYYIDLDNFKYINDTYGHSHGDVVLKTISRRIVDCCDKRFFSARLSGDEFGVVVTWEKEIEEIESIAEKMLKLFNEPIYYQDLEFSVTGSIGISVFPDDGKTFEELLSNADIAMYEAKSNLKNQHKIFNQELRKSLIKRVEIESSLLQSIARNEMVLFYQPLIDFETKKTIGFEALVRWNHGKLGMIFPDQFIHIAEHNLFINKLGYFVIEEALKFGNELHEKYGVYYEMNVNVSLVQLHLENFVGEVKGLLEKYNYPAQYLNLEITESVALESDKRINQKLIQLRSVGVPISLDDFGTGYSSFNHLLSLALTHLKIDRMIILEAIRKVEVYKLLKALVEFSHAINLKVIAEGIENPYMEELMEKINIDFAQGYMYSKPVSREDIFIYLANEKEDKQQNN